jgi:hypothetical protein
VALQLVPPQIDRWVNDALNQLTEPSKAHLAQRI